MLKKFLPVIILFAMFNTSDSQAASSSSQTQAMTYHVINYSSKPEVPGSIAWAVNNINSIGGSGHVIEFDESIKAITLTQELTINSSVTFEGDGVCITGSGNSRLFTVTNGRVIFNNMTFTKGYAVENNGGAVNIEGQEASAEFTNCTFYDNTADNYGGAVCLTNGSDKNFTILTHCTIANNDAQDGGGLAIVKGDAKIFASIVTGNTDYEIYKGDKATLAGSYNIFGDYDSNIGENNLAGQAANQVLVTDSDGNIKLEGMNNIQIIKLAAASPARDYISSSNKRIDFDETGTLRPQLSDYDAGAFEALPVPVEKVMITGTPYMQVNTDYTFSADISPLDASVEEVVWKSNNEQVLTIDENGNAEALTTGTAYVTAEVHGWDSDGKKKVQSSSEALLITVGTDALGAMRASLLDLDDITLSKGRYTLITPEVLIEVNGIEVTNAKYSLKAESSRSDIITAEIVSGDMLRLSASEEMTGSADIRVTVQPLPDGYTDYKDFTASVAESVQVLGASKSSGGCNSGFGGVLILFAGAYIVLLAVVKFGSKKSRKESRG